MSSPLASDPALDAVPQKAPAEAPRAVPQPPGSKTPTAPIPVPGTDGASLAIMPIAASPVERARTGERSSVPGYDVAFAAVPGHQELTIQVVRALFVVISASLGWDLARKISSVANWYHPLNVLGLGAGLAFGLSMVVFEVKSSKQFTANMFTIVLGLFLGFIGSHLFFQGLLLIPHVNLLSLDHHNMIKLFLTLVFCYLAIVVLFEGKDQFKLIIPFVETEPAPARPAPWLLDTSVIIDGRIENVLLALQAEGPVVVPGFVLQELHQLADSRDRLKRQRGRRGLDLLAALKRSKKLPVEVDDGRAIQGGRTDGGADTALVDLAARTGGRVVTNDASLRKICQIQGASCISLNELADALKPVVLPGEAIALRLLRAGEQPDQAVGYLDDGTLVVVEHARARIGQTVDAEVTSVLQTHTGRMIFARPRDA